MNWDKELFQVGDMITVKATGRRARKVVAVNDNHLLVEVAGSINWCRGRPPAKVWYSQVMSNHDETARDYAAYDLEMEFLDNFENFKATLADAASI